MTTYNPPLDILMVLGDVREMAPKFDYGALGFTQAHIPDVLRMATDFKLMRLPEEDPAQWSSVHAWRVLGLLEAEDAVPQLVQLFGQLEGSYWTAAELPVVFAQIGKASIEPLTSFLQDSQQTAYARARAIRSLETIGATHPVYRDRIISIITAELHNYADNQNTLNGFLVKGLVNLKVNDSAQIELIRKAYRANQVHPQAAGGDLPAILEKLGIQQRILPNEKTTSTSQRERQQRAKKKAQRKQKKQARKRNRK